MTIRYMDNTRSGFRRIIDYHPELKQYHWYIYDLRTFDTVSCNHEATLDDARRIVRSTSKFLTERHK